MKKLTVGLILVAVGLFVFARRDAAQAAADTGGKVGGAIDPGMAVRSPFNGDPGMVVRSPFDGDRGMVVNPEVPPAAAQQSQAEQRQEQ